MDYRSGDLLRKGKYAAMKSRTGMARESAEGLAIQALTYLGEDPERLGRFLTVTGIGPDRIRAASGEPGFLAGVLAYIASDEQLAAEFTALVSCGQGDIARAHEAMGGNPWERDVP
ncbi:MAG TPA: DUF3572 domain-containing protein [Pseudolabrys sp.]|nr:DUF3572 domain-containing protein [Pseudolabrys sp.]